METEECILTRRSIRKFKKTKVEWDKVGRIMEAGRVAPSSGNVQNWHFIAVDDEGKRKAITEACFNQDWMAAAPVHIVICCKPGEVKRHYGIRGERLYAVQNCAAAAQNMLLTAHDLGLGACWVGAFEEDKIISLLGVAKGARPQIIVAIGYADEDPLPPMKWKLDNVAYINKWMGRIRDDDEFLGYSSSVRIRKLISGGKRALEKAKKKLQR